MQGKGKIFLDVSTAQDNVALTVKYSCGSIELKVEK